MKKKLFFSVFFLLSAQFFLSAASSSLVAANRRTAVRCLKLSESFLSSDDYTNALAQAELGLAYDESVSDLWYVKAASRAGLGATRAELIPLVTHALTEGEWVDYNRDGARILYADLLCDTGNYEQAIGILDAEPFIYSSDAEFIRAKSYYRIRTAESVEKARDKINSARKIYPADKRFPKLFFKHEYDLLRVSGFYVDSSGNKNSSEKTDVSAKKDDSALVQKIADSFLAKMPEYDNPDAELEIYSVFFASGEQQRRLAEAFASHGMRHPLYALIALKCDLMNQQEAWDYFCSFADESVSVEMLQDILPMLTDELTVDSVKEHLNSFSGILTFDTDFDLEPNLTAKYMRGRPANFSWDKENDGVIEWSAECDFGVPESLYLTRGNIQLYYGTYPSVVRAVFDSDKISGGEAVFNLVDEALDWSPFEIKPLEIAKNLFDFDFYVPYIFNYIEEIDENALVRNCSNYEISSEERPGARIRFYVLNGEFQTAEYFADGKIYARAEFVEGFPSVRSVDNDGDGIFETVETFGYDPENLYHVSEPEQKQIMTNLFGHEIAGSGIYLKMIQIDSNGDTVPDFSEEYLADNGKISSWDFDADSRWELRYKRYPQADSASPVIEDAQFYTNPDRKLVTVTLWNGIPVKVEYENQFFPVTQGASDSFYWIGKEGNADDEKFLLENFDKSFEQGVSVILQNKNVRMMAVRIGQNIYGEILPFYDETIYDENKQNDE